MKLNGGLLRRGVLRALSREEFSPETRLFLMRSTRRALEHCSLPDLLVEAGRVTGLEDSVVEERALASLLMYCGVGVTDDGHDGDADYLDEAHSPALVSNMLFQVANLIWEEPDPSVRAAVSMDLVLAGAGAAIELEASKKMWGAQPYIHVGETISGIQFRAYFRALWAGTTLYSKVDLARSIGIVCHVAEDIRVQDKRICSLSEKDYQTVLEWAEKHRLLVLDSPLSRYAGESFLDRVAATA